MLDWILIGTPDDAFYYYQLVTGSTAWNETNGYHPLWALMLLPLGLLLQGDSFVYAATGLYYALWLTIPIVFHRLYKTRLAYTIWLIPIVLRGAIGMEFPLVVLLSGIAYQTRRPGIIALMILARLDTAILALFITPIRQWPRVGIYILPWFLFSYVAVGTIIPDSATHITNVNWQQGLRAITLYYGLAPLLSLGLVLTQPKYRLLAILTITLFIVDATRNTIWPWHYIYLPLILTLALKQICSRLNIAPLRSYRPVFVLTLLAMSLLSLPMLREHYPQHLIMVEVAKQGIVVEGSLGAYNSGIAGFYNSQKVYNLDGIFNHNVQPTDYIIDFSLYVDDNLPIVRDYGGTSNAILENYALFKRD